MELAEVEKVLTDAERAVERRIGEARGIASQRDAARAEADDLDEAIESYDEAMAVLSSYADARQRDLQDRIERLVSHGLRTIFGEGMTFHVRPTTRGKLNAMDLVVRTVVDDKEVETPVMDARGGGVAAVVGFLLRLILILLRKDARPMLFLDETFAQLSAEYEPRLAEFIRELVDRTPVQIVLVTHSDAYVDAADRMYRFDLEDGVTKVRAAT